MRRTLFNTLGVVFLVLFVGSAVSQTYTASPISGVFRPGSCEYGAGATQDTCIFQTGVSGDPSFSGADANMVSWGLEAGDGLSSLTWQPVGSAQLEPGVVTLVGRMRHTNRPIDGDNDDLIPNAVHWDLDIDITVSPGGQTFQYQGQFKLDIEETDNTPVDPIVGCPFEDNWSPDALPYPWTNDLPCCPYNTEKEVAVGQDTINGPCSDKISIILENDADKQTFQDGNTLYSLILDGFRPTEDPQAQAIVNFFISQEKTSTDAFLFVSWTATCADVNDCDNGNVCTLGSCNAQGKCVQNNVPGSCTPSASVNECQKGSCLNGECSVITNSTKQGSLCGSLINDECRKTLCQSGTCVDLTTTYNGDSCSVGTAAAPECRRNICQAGTCGPSGTTAGSCTGTTATDCTTRVCSSGTCGLSNKPDGTTCTTGSAGVCNRLGCNSGVCAEIFDNALLNTECTPTMGSNTEECKGFLCRPGSGIAGTCTLRNLVGSCTGLSVLDCNARMCSSGVCTYTEGTASDCGTPPECKYYTCTGTAAPYSCTLMDRTSGSCTSLSYTDCTKPRCRSGTCSAVSRNKNQPCSTGSSGPYVGTEDDCNQALCESDNSGNCVIRALSGVTCSLGNVTDSDCSRGSCYSGSCSAAVYNEGGSCTAGLGQASLAAPSFCARRICSGMTCIYAQNNTADPNTDCGALADDCSEYKCSPTNATNPGTCTTTFVSAAASGSCTSDGTGSVNATSNRCKIRKCDGAGTCAEVDRATNDLCRNDEGAFCRDERCNSMAMCVNVSANEGSLCNEDGVIPPAPSDCYVNKCDLGTCKRDNKDAGSDCRPSSNNRCLEYTCDAVGICIISDSFSNKSCTGYNPQTSTLPEECRAALCDGEGTCAYAAANEGDPCGTVSNLCKPKYCQSGGQCEEEPLNIGDVCQNATVEESCNKRRCTKDLKCEADPAFNGKACTPKDVEGVVVDFCGEFACDEGTCRTEAKNVDKICCPPGEEGEECEKNFQNPTNCTDEEGNKIPCDGGNFDSKCREFRCSEDGTCKTVPLGTDVSCGNPGGFYCKEYTCDGRGHCDRANPKNITNAPCVGIDSSGILTECQLFECDESAVCKSKIVEEGKECRNPQPTTNKRGTGDDIGPCEIATCNAFGRCELIILEDGTGCSTPENEDNACWVGVCQDGECIENLTECQNNFLAGSSTFEGEEDDLCYYYYCDTVSGECAPDTNKSACSCAGCESCIKQREGDGIPCLWCSYRDPSENSGTKCFHEDVISELASLSSGGWSFECEGAEPVNATAESYTCPEGEKSCQDSDSLCGTDGNSLPFHWAYIVAAVAALASLGCIVCLLLAIAAALLLMIVKSATDTVAVIDTTGIAVNLKENPLYSNKYVFSENPLNH